MKPILGFIGTGVMGVSIAGHLLNAGYTLHLYNRTQSKAQPLLERGAVWQESPAALAPHCDVIFTMVGFPADVEATYLGKTGLLKTAKAGTLLVDMTTSKPSLAAKITEAAEKIGCMALDAPVSGGDIGAREARLSIMVGGTAEAFQKAKPFFEIFGKQISHMGGAGMGQHTKMSNQIAIASNMMGVCEALTYAKKSGLNPEQVLEAISAGAAGSHSLNSLAPRILKEDYSPGFYMKHFIKDLKIAIESADEMGLHLPSMRFVCHLYEKLADAGYENEGTQALIRWYQDQLEGESK